MAGILELKTFNFGIAEIERESRIKKKRMKKKNTGQARFMKLL